MKDLLETVKSLYVGKSEEEISRIHKELEYLYLYSKQKWWLPFRLQIRFCEPYKIEKDLVYLTEIIEKESETFDKGKFSSTLIKNELEKYVQNNEINSINRTLIKKKILNLYSSKKSAIFLMRLIKDEYFIQRRRWWLGLIIGWGLGFITALATVWLRFILNSPIKIPTP